MRKLILRCVVAVVCFAFLTNAVEADAQAPAPTGGQAAAIFAILIAIPVGVGLGIYYAVRAPRSVKGCASSASGGLELTDEKGRVYDLTGNTADVLPATRMRLSGKAEKHKKEHWKFAVSKVSGSYGACTVAAQPH